MRQFKVCTKCGEKKPLSDYYAMRGMRDGHRNDCIDCNHGLGKFQDDPTVLLRAVVYLREGGFLELLAESA